MKKLTTEQYVELDNKLVRTLFSFKYGSNSFWAQLAMRMRRVPDHENCCTLSTALSINDINLHYNPAFVKEASQEQLRYHLVHECLHLVYRHMFRFAGSEDVIDLGSLRDTLECTANPKLPIKAADLAADLIANRDATCAFSENQKYGVSMQTLCNFNMPRWEEAASEDVEKYLINRFTKVIKEKKSAPNISIQLNNKNKQENSDETATKNATMVQGNTVNKHDSVTTEQLTDAQKDMMQRFIEKTVRNSRANAERGNLPRAVCQELDLLCKPPRQDWRNVLNQIVRYSIPASSVRTWARINRRFPYLCKGKKPRRVPLIAVALDTSGSVSDVELTAFLEEINHIRAVYKSNVDIIQCDCTMKNVQHIPFNKKIPALVSGRGGTEYLPVLEYLDKQTKKPDILIFFTDLAVFDEDVPSEARRYNIAWVCTNETQCEHFQKLDKYGSFIFMRIEEPDNDN